MHPATDNKAVGELPLHLAHTNLVLLASGVLVPQKPPLAAYS